MVVNNILREKRHVRNLCKVAKFGTVQRKASSLTPRLLSLHHHFSCLLIPAVFFQSVRAAPCLCPTASMSGINDFVSLYSLINV